MTNYGSDIAGAIFAIAAILCWHWGSMAGAIITGVVSFLYLVSVEKK
jgi:hypothetical protein